MKHFYTFTLTFIMLCFYGEAQNLLTNSTFADVAAWTVVNTTGSLNTDSHTDDGTGSYELLAQDGNTNGHIKHNQIIASNLQPGDYVMTCWVKGGIGSRVKLQVFQGGAMNAPVYETLSVDWEQISHVFTLEKAGASPRIFNSKNDGTSVVLIDDVVFERVMTEAPATSDLTTASGWYAINATSTETATVQTLNMDNAAPKLKLYDHYVDADANKFMTITLQNNSVNTGLQISYHKSDGSGEHYMPQTISADDSESKTYEFDMTNDNWSGNVANISFTIKQRNAEDTAWASAEQGGTVAFNTVSFSAASLSSKRFQKGFNFYPNPANNSITIDRFNGNDKLDIFSVLGKKVMTINDTSNPIDISNLSPGIYIIKSNNNTQKLIKK